MSLDLTKTELRLTDIYEFVLSDGLGTKKYLTPYGGTYTKLPKIGGNEYQTVVISRTKVGAHTDLQLDTIDVTLGILAFTVQGKTIREAIQLGWFDNAEVIVSMVNPALVTETREIFRGTVGKGIKYNRKSAKFSVNSLNFLKQTVPRIVYQSPCNHQLWDKYCQLNKTAYEVTGSAGAGSDQTNIYNAAFAYATHASPYYVLGEIRMTSGANAGISRTMRTHNDGNIEVYDPFDFAIAVGDTFKVYPGCDKSGQTCDEKFSNYLNFGGYEYIPRPEVMY